MSFWHYVVGIAICGLMVWINLSMAPDHAERAGQAPDALTRLYHITRTTIVMFLCSVILAIIIVIIEPDMAKQPSPRQMIDLLAATFFFSVIWATRYPTYVD